MPAVTIKKPPSHYLKKLHFDTIVFSEQQLKHLIETWGADHIMLGTDYPFDMGKERPVDVVNAVPGLSEVDRDRVRRGNALGLLGLPA